MILIDHHFEVIPFTRLKMINEAKERMGKRWLQKKENTRNVPKNEHFLVADTNTFPLLRMNCPLQITNPLTSRF